MSSKTDRQLVEYIESLNSEYLGASIFTNWKRLNDNITDAVNQQYRPGEQFTRQGMYFAVMRAQRDGWREGAADLFGQANPLFLYRPRRDVPVKLANRVQETVSEIWTDINGLMNWLALWNDAVDFSMAIGYTKYCKYHGEYEKPVVESDVYIDRLEWKTEFDALADSPDFIRVHPYNYRCALGAGRPEWEMVEWEWTVSDLKAMMDDGYNTAAVKRILDKIEKGQAGTEGQDFYSQHRSRNGAEKPKRTVYAKEFWGRLSGCEGYEGDAQEYCVIVCEGEILRKQVNRLRIGRNFWRPIKKILLDPLNDLPYGAHVLAPVLPHQRMKNLMLNLAADDLLIRQHLGLAVWPSALMNPNQLLNPEGAREPLFMRADANVNQIPRFFADQASGVVRDVQSFDTNVIERDLQVAGLPYQALGLGGGAQGKTATEQTYLANTASRKMRVAIINSIHTGLKPIISDMLGLLLRNNQPADLGLGPQEQFQIFQNNFFDFDTSLTQNLPAQAAALANWGSMAMQAMSQVTPTSSPGSADHLIRYLKDSGKALGLSTVAMDAYLPEGMPPQVQPQQPGTPPAAPGAPPQPGPEAEMIPEAADVV
jgi:hypothetical protein